MSRSTLKLPKRDTPPTAERSAPKSSRGQRALKDRQRNAPAAAPEPRSERPSRSPRAEGFDRSPRDKGFDRPARSESFDSSPRPAPAWRPPSPPATPSQPDLPRLSKRMSELGLCSRREAEEWIVNGWVRVDGNVIDELGARVPRDARIDIDPAARAHQSELVTILLNKPVGYVSGQPEDGHEPAIALIRPENRWAQDPSPLRFKPSHLRGLAPAGRLDIDSTGLLVFTQDGRVARRLIGSDSDVEKEYLVRVERMLSDEGMRLLHHGLALDGVQLRPARVSWQNEDQLRFVLREGRKRQIRRMCELVGLRVVGLKRVRSGGVPLGPLPPGQWRYLRPGEKF